MAALDFADPPPDAAVAAADSPPARRVLLLVTDAGGGHRASAESLKAAIARRRLPWHVEIVNVYAEVWQQIEWTRLFGFSGEGLYNFILKRSWTGAAAALRPLASALFSLHERSGVHLLRSYLGRRQPDLVVSLLPFVNDVVAEAAADTATPFGVVMTDLVDTKPPMWLTPRACAGARFVAVPCREAAEAARAGGVSADRLSETGLLIHPKYFAASTRALTPRAAREQFGLSPDPFTVAITMGGFGGSVIRRLVEAFEGSPVRWQVIACAGRNSTLEADLIALAPRLRNRLVVLGFSTELHAVMRAADVVVTKPGPASIVECLAMGTPIVLDDAATMPQERPNAGFVERGGFGVAVAHRGHLFDAVRRLAADPALRQAMRERVSQCSQELRDAAPSIIGAMARAMRHAGQLRCSSP